ncbi:MAG: hypothetical protein WC606_00990 [Candidatus Absconditabacterales bacterium]
MKQLIYIHGGMCFPNNDAFCRALETRDYNPFENKNDRKDWFEELKGIYQIIRPEMPNKNMASYKAWKIRFEKIFPYLNDEYLIIVGHSLGAMFLVKYLGENKFPKKIKQLHLMSTVFDESDMSDEEKYAGDFAYDPKIIPNIEDQAEEIFLYHSTDDDLVPYSHTEKIKAYLPKAKLMTFTDRGHFFQSEIPEIIANIRA